ncbi:MAG: hypothetical protein VB878_06155 [Pirellulaceae bacterium]
MLKQLLLAAPAIVVVVVVSVTSTAQVTKGKTRLATTSQIMRGFVRPNHTNLHQGTEKLPTNKKEWQALATNAALLNEASYLLMDDDRCPDDDWASAAMTLRRGSAAAVRSIKVKDTKSMAAAFRMITHSCASCHDMHK